MSLSNFERLNVYKMMLRDYRWSPMYLVNGYKVKKNVQLGFCYWLTMNKQLSLNKFPELLNLQPPADESYWFPIGARRPRYKVLKQAIAAVKKVI